MLLDQPSIDPVEDLPTSSTTSPTTAPVAARTSPRRRWSTEDKRALVEASLCLGAVFRRVEVEDISLGGVRVRLPETVALGTKVFVTIEGLPNLPSVLRWQIGGYAGIAFEAPLELDTLAFWLAERQ